MIKALLILLLVFCGAGIAQETQDMKLPYINDAARCYEQLKQVNSAYREGFGRLQQIASLQSPFDERLHSLLQEHEQILIRGKATPPQTEWREEDVYLCCLYDLLEAFFAEEAQKRAQAGPGKNAFQDLRRQLDAIPFESPKWKNGARVHIQKTVQEIARRSGDEK